MKKATILSIALGALPMAVFAQEQDVDSLIGLFAGWIAALLPVVIALAVLYFLWGLAKFILNADDPEAQKSARGIMIWGVIIIFVMGAVWGLVNVIGNSLDLDNTAVKAPLLPGQDGAGGAN